MHEYCDIVKCFTSHKNVMDDEWTYDIHCHSSNSLNNYFSNFSLRLNLKKKNTSIMSL